MRFRIGLIGALLSAWAGGCNPGPAPGTPQRATSSLGTGGRLRTGVGPPPNRASRPANSVPTVEDFINERKADEGAFQSKYEGKRIELQGRGLNRVSRPLFGKFGFTLYGNQPKVGAVVVELRKADQAKLAGRNTTGRNQEYIVRGTVAVGIKDVGLALTDAELVKFGPTPPVPTTVAALYEDGELDEEYRTLTSVLSDVILRVEVQSNFPAVENTQQFMITDPGKSAPRMIAWSDSRDPAEAKKWAGIKPGTVVILVGRADLLPTMDPGLERLRLYPARVLSAPPEGVTLPEANK
jgi:hypothetical protein